MTEGEQVDRVIKAWQDEAGDGLPFGLSAGQVVGIAEIAVRALAPQCTGWHPHRPDIRCSIADHAMPEHRNDQLGLEWTDDGRTHHDELGEIALIAEQDGQNMTAPAEDGVANTSPLESLLGVLQEASGALETVGKAYHSTSKRVTAPVYRAVRDAKESADRTITELTNASRVVQTGG